MSRGDGGCDDLVHSAGSGLPYSAADVEASGPDRHEALREPWKGP